MSTTGKIGLMLALLLVGAFAFFAYHRLHKQDDLVAQIRGMVNAETDGETNPSESQSPPARTADQTGDRTQTASSPDGSYRSRTAEDQRYPTGSGSGSRSALGESTTEPAVAGGSGSREPGAFSDPGNRVPAADSSSSFPPASDTRTTGFATSPAGSQSDPFAQNGASSGHAGTADGDRESNPFGPQSEPGTATTATGRPSFSDGVGNGDRHRSTGEDRSSSSADAGPGPFGSGAAAHTPAGRTSAKPGSTEVVGDEFTNPWDSSPSGSPPGTTTETDRTDISDPQSGSDRRSVADSNPQGAFDRTDQGVSRAVTSADSSAVSGTPQVSPETSTAPWESRAVSSGGASTGGVDPVGTDSSFSSSGEQGVSDPFDSVSPRSGTSASGGEFGQTRSDEPRPIAYVVQSGDNYWRISKKLYGTGRYFTALARYNKPRIPDSRRMRPGMQILVPSRAVLETRYPDLRLKSRGSRVGNAKAPRAKLPSGFFHDANGDPLYRVGARDTLSGIALRHLGRSSRWIQIRELNRDRLPGGANLKIGTVLRLPADASQVQLVREPRNVR